MILPYVEFSYNNSYQASIEMHCTKPYMDDSAELRYNGVSPEKVSCLDLNY
jgi:hypothetical protein